MKRLFKKNQIIITTLAIMIAVAGYLNYSGRIFGESGKAEATNGELANQELLDITSEDGAQETAGDIESQDQEVADGTVEGTPGEAVLTNGDVTGVVAEAKVTREQVRAKNKETLLEIIISPITCSEGSVCPLNIFFIKSWKSVFFSGKISSSKSSISENSNSFQIVSSASF